MKDTTEYPVAPVRPEPAEDTPESPEDGGTGGLPSGGEAMFRALAETAHDAIFFTDDTGRVRFWNGAAETMFGYRAGEISGRPLAIILPPRLRESHERGLERALSGTLPVSGKTTEITGLRKDGGEFPLELTLATWRAEGRVFLTAIARDITERRRAEEELRESEERYRSLFRESPIALWEEDFSGLRAHFDDLRHQGVWDFRRHLADGPDAAARCLSLIRVVDVNRAALEMFGARSGRELEGNLQAVFPEDSPDVRKESLVALWEGRSVFETEGAAASLAGQKKHVFLRFVVSPPGRSRRLLSIIDLTSRKKLELQLFQAQKMEALGRLAGGVAHDFNNLLTAVRTNADLLLMELDREGPLHQAAAAIGHTVEEASTLTRRLLEMSRPGEPAPTVMDLNDTVRKMGRLLPHLLGPSVRWEMEMAPGIPSIRANEGQIEQILLNLVVNARDAMPEGGVLGIATAAARTASGPEGPDGGPFVSLVVTDTGEGIPAEHLPHIFEPFYTTKADGTGMGLSTVYGIVRQLGGRVEAANRREGGAVFSVLLPAAASG